MDKDNHMYHIGKGNGPIGAVDILRQIDVESYGLEPAEQIAAGAVKAYLCGLTQRDALEILRLVMRSTILKIPALDAQPELLRAIVEGEQLIGLIDQAVADGIARIKRIERVERIRERTGSDAVLRTTALDALQTIRGKEILEDVSPEFLGFLADCYKGLSF